MGRERLCFKESGRVGAAGGNEFWIVVALSIKGLAAGRGKSARSRTDVHVHNCAQACTSATNTFEKPRAVSSLQPCGSTLAREMPQ
jgi:hypothetical protein